MKLLDLDNFSLSVGSTFLLENVTTHVVAGQHVALIGSNSSGKSTLLRALANPDDTSAYYTVNSGGVTLYDSVLHVEQDDLHWSHLLGGDEDELRALTLPDALDMSLNYNTETALDDIDNWRRLSMAASETLGWGSAHYDSTPLGELSPGCSVRAYLAIALLRNTSGLLFLDEPTNHLDLPTLLWLQHAIRASRKTVIFVSHDATFIDTVADRIWVIDDETKTIVVSSAKYSDFRAAEELAREQQRAAYEVQQQRYKQLTDVANKLRDKSTAGSRFISPDHDLIQRDIKRERAGRSGRKASAIETRRDSEEVIEKVVDHIPLSFSIDPLGAGRDANIIFNYVAIGYNGTALSVPPLSFRIEFGERIGIVGANGCGKSTLFRTITGDLPPVSGDVSVGRELRLGNLMQEHESLPRDMTPRDYVAKLTGLREFDAGTRVIKYGISRSQVDKPICQVNPGARARLLMASFIIRKVNALVLDEPTNHLDEEAVREIIGTLSTFAGTVLVVSHNREFLESVHLTRLMKLTPRGLTVIDSVDDYVRPMEDDIEKLVKA